MYQTKPTSSSVIQSFIFIIIGASWEDKKGFAIMLVTLIIRELMKAQSLLQ